MLDGGSELKYYAFVECSLNSIPTELSLSISHPTQPNIPSKPLTTAKSPERFPGSAIAINLLKSPSLSTFLHPTECTNLTTSPLGTAYEVSYILVNKTGPLISKFPSSIKPSSVGITRRTWISQPTSIELNIPRRILETIPN